MGRTRDPLLAWLDGLDPEVVVVLDPGSAFASLDPALRDRVLRRTHLWTGNADEAGRLTGRDEPAAAAEVIAALIAPGGVAIVRDGARGCHLREGGHTAYLRGFPQHPVDTNGAGDTHTGVLLAGRARGEDWAVAARRANAAGAITVTRRGPATAPTAGEIDEFLAAQAGSA
jgi:sugar/nucleoside kinase (ribokinase family)